MVVAIDDLAYSYDDGGNSNKLINVADALNHPAGFDDRNRPAQSLKADFEYDDYGNLTVDRNKGIREIFYNHLNLPKKIVFETGEINYLYDATGVKLKKTVHDIEVGADVNTHYIDGFQYTENHLDFFPHAEGYVNVLDFSEFHYIYTYKDHLGNIRLKYTRDPDSGCTEILEEDHYYPFGLTHKGYNSSHRTIGWDAPSTNITLIPVTTLEGDKHKYKFNGMEFQDELDLNHYDFGARNYDPALGRWMNIDPLAEYQFTYSPYGFAFNNPIYYVDPDGMFPISPFNNSGIGTGSFDKMDLGGNGISNGGDDPPKKDPNFPGTSGVQQLDEVVIVAKKDDKGCEGIPCWGNGTEDLGRKLGTRQGGFDINDMPTIPGGAKTGSNLMDFWRWLIDLLNITEKLDKKMPDPNKSSMEEKEEPVETPEEKAIIKLKKVYPHFNRWNGKTNDLITTKTYDTLVDKSDIPRVFKVKDSINKSKIDKAREKFNQRYEKK